MANFFDNMGKKAKDFSETNRLNGELGRLRQQRMEMFSQLGQMYYDHKKSENADEPDYARLIEAIDAVNANTRAVEEKIAQIKGDAICPKCNGIVPQGNRFCPHCGGEMPLPPPPQMPSYGQPGMAPPPGFAQPPMGQPPMGQPPMGAPVPGAETPLMQPGGDVCKNCGTPILPNAKFCAKCGTPTGFVAPPAQDTPPEEDSAREESSAQEEPPAEEEKTGDQPPEESTF